VFFFKKCLITDLKHKSICFDIAVTYVSIIVLQCINLYMRQAINIHVWCPGPGLRQAQTYSRV